jgi:hypothetical protein
MKVAVKFVYPCHYEQVSELKALVKNSEKQRYQKRAFAHLLSSDGLEVDDIAKIFGA